MNCVVNMDEINGDFFIYEFRAVEKYIKYGALVLDKITGIPNVCSVVFENGKVFYVLAQREISELNVRKFLDSDKEGQLLRFNRVSAEMVPSNLLVQLFFNSLNNYLGSEYSFNNITGKLYCYNPKLFVRKKKKGQEYISQIPALEIKVSSRNILTFRVVTFTSLQEKGFLKFGKKKIHQYAVYDLAANNSLRRIVSESPNEQGFIIKQFSNKKSNIPLLSFSNYNDFQLSKCGNLSRVLNVFGEKFKPYFNLEFKRIYDCSEVVFCEERIGNIGSIVQEGIVIENASSELYSEAFADDLRNALGKLGVKINQEDGQTTLLKIIDNKEFYEAYPDLEDKHETSDNRVVQNVTFQDFSCNVDAAIRCIIKELAIKRDIVKGKLEILDWHLFDFEEDIKFYKKIETVFHSLIINTQGQLFYVKSEYAIDNVDSELERLLPIFEKYKSEIECVVSYQGEFFIFLKTELLALPDFFSIEELLRREMLPLTLSSNELANYLNRINDKNVGKIIDDLKPITYSREKILELIPKNQTTIRKKLSAIIEQETGIILKNYLRQAAYKYDLFSSNLHIKYCYESVSYNYFVGEIAENINLHFNFASNIRKIICGKNEVLIEKLMQLMSVDFVRNEQLTVLPFPVKYLNEYILLDVK